MATVKVDKSGKAQKGLSVGTTVQTAGGNYQITGVRPDGSYISTKVPSSSTPAASIPAAPSVYGGTSTSSPTLDDFIKINTDYQKRYDPDTKTAYVSNVNTGKEISFGLGQGQQYGLGGLQGGSHTITDQGKLIAALSGPMQQPTQAAQPTTSAYTSPYSDQMGKTLAALLGRSFSYDPQSDVGLQAAQKSATDAVARSAARRNMLYSDSNKAQMGESALSLVPQFRQQAMSEYQQQGNDLYNQLNALQGLENTTYGRYRDTVGDTRYADETAYSRGRDVVTDQRYNQQLAYQQGRDKIEDERYANEFAENVRQFGLEYALKQADAKLAAQKEARIGSGGSSGDYKTSQRIDDELAILKATGKVPKGGLLEQMYGVQGEGVVDINAERQELIGQIRNQDITPEEAYARIEQDVKLGFYTAQEANQLKSDLYTLTGYPKKKEPKALKKPLPTVSQTVFSPNSGGSLIAPFPPIGQMK